MDVSKDMINPGVPAWGLFVNVDEFVASHPDWLLISDMLTFYDADDLGMSLYPSDKLLADVLDREDSLRVVGNHVAASLEESAVLSVLQRRRMLKNGNTSNSIVVSHKSPAQIVCVGFHVTAAVDHAYPLSIAFLFAVAPQYAVLFDSSNATVECPHPQAPSIVLHMLFTNSPILVSDLDRLELQNRDLKFVSLDSNCEHAWLHHAFVASSGRRLLWFEVHCTSADPVFLAQVCIGLDIQTVLDVKRMLSVESSDLSREQNEFRLVASSLFDSVKYFELDKAVSAVVNMPVC